MCVEKDYIIRCRHGGVTTKLFLEENELGDAIKCFADNNPLKQNMDFNGIKVYSCDRAFADYTDEVVLISCGEGDEIIRQLSKYNISKEKIFIPDINVIDESDPQFIMNHVDLLNNLYHSFGDEKSRKVMLGILNYRMTHDMQYISQIADKSQDQYFDSKLMHYKKDDVFLDCGAYTGDTADEYIRHNGGKYRKIICLEADEDNCRIISQKAKQLRIELRKLACWSEATRLSFDKIGSGSGTILVDGNPKAATVEVMADTIDHIVGDEKISFIKMDIEGAEYDALLGARHTIEKYRPTLMISVYHKQDDLIRIPALIRSMNYNYTFYLRHYRSLSVQETILYAI